MKLDVDSNPPDCLADLENIILLVADHQEKREEEMSTTVVHIIFRRGEEVPTQFVTSLLRHLQGEEVLLQTIAREDQILTPAPERETDCLLVVVYATHHNHPGRLEKAFTDLRARFPGLQVRYKIVD